jgi:hypothetical protein
MMEKINLKYIVSTYANIKMNSPLCNYYMLIKKGILKDMETMNV